VEVATKFIIQQRKFIMGVMFSFIPQAPANPSCRIEWERRYDGALSVALLDSKRVAGISGPWPDGSFALTWWSTQHFAILPVLEFHNTMEAAKERVEEIAYQLRRMTSKNAFSAGLDDDIQRISSAALMEAANDDARA
jgi:hypothetical protein